MPAAADVSWTDAVGAIGAVSTPLVVVGIGFIVSQRLKRLERLEWRNQALIAARLGFYREIAEPLNDLLCYFTFIGGWKEQTPPQVIELKRSLDRVFHTLSPFFGPEVAGAYDDFMKGCFSTFGDWGADARLRTNFHRRKMVARATWDPGWESMFAYGENDPVPEDELVQIKVAYNGVLHCLVGDIQLVEARPEYASARVVLNA